MKTVSISEAKNNLSALLREVRGGTHVVISDRGIPVAQLVAPPSTRGISASAVELAQQGRLRLPEHQPNSRWLDDRREAPRRGRSAVKALLEERESSR